MKKIQHHLLTNDTSSTTKQFCITGTMKGPSEEPDRKTLIIINDDDVEFIKDADDEADEPAHV